MTYQKLYLICLLLHLRRRYSAVDIDYLCCQLPGLLFSQIKYGFSRGACILYVMNRPDKVKQKDGKSLEKNAGNSFLSMFLDS